MNSKLATMFQYHKRNLLFQTYKKLKKLEAIQILKKICGK